MISLAAQMIKNLDRDEQEVSDCRYRKVNSDNINLIFSKYYTNLGINNKNLFSAFKTQSSFRSNRGKRSFACILSDIGSQTIQQGYIGQLDPKYFEMCSRIYEDVVKRLPFIEEEASKIFCFMGALPSPLVCAPPVPDIARRESDMSPDISTEFANFVEKFVSFIFEKSYEFFKQGKIQVVDKITSNGNPGLPESINIKGHILNANVNYYADRAFSIFKKAQITNVNNLLKEYACLDFIDELGLERVFLKHGLLFFYRDQHRGQPDSAHKERFGFTRDTWKTFKPYPLNRDEVISKYYSEDYPHLVSSYTTKVHDKNVTHRIRSKKNRLVFAESHSMNGPINIFLSKIRKSYGAKWSKVFKCSDQDELQSNLDNFIERCKIDLDDYDLIIFDITQYDNTFARGLMKAYLKGIDAVFPNLASLITLCNLAPGGIMLPYDGIDIRSIRNKLFLTGDPFDYETFHFGIAPSGTGDVTEKAKLPSLAFCLFTLLGKFDSNQIDKILNWDNPLFVIANLGDNNLILAHKRLEMRSKITNSAEFKVDISEAGIFGGLMVRREHQIIKVSPSPVSTLIKVLAPERPLDDEMRSSYELGTVDRYALGSKDLNTSIILEAIDRHARNIFLCRSQIEIARDRLANQNDTLASLYRELEIARSMSSDFSVSKFFIDALASGGDKLFYTDIYERMSSKEQEIIDSLFFTVFESDETDQINKILGEQNVHNKHLD